MMTSRNVSPSGSQSPSRHDTMLSTVAGGAVDWSQKGCSGAMGKREKLFVMKHKRETMPVGWICIFSVWERGYLASRYLVPFIGSSKDEHMGSDVSQSTHLCTLVVDSLTAQSLYTRGNRTAH